jgi:uncharacterized damage-inducible protein DinB
MISATYATRLAAYNRWINERVYTCAATLADDARRRDVGAYFKSIHGTLNHLLLADRLWMGRFTGVPFCARALDDELYADFAELRAQRALTDGVIVEWAAALSDAQLAGALRYTTMVNPQTKTFPLWWTVTHFFNHQTHHRGQVTTMLMQHGVDPGVTDLMGLPVSDD